MDALEPTTTSWGSGSEQDVDVRALRRYSQFLKMLESIAEWLVFALIPLIGCASVWLVTKTNFENVVFYDGTDSICIYNGDTGEIRNVE